MTSLALVASFGIYDLFRDASIVEFFKKHPVLMALPASAAWFYAGRDYFRKGNLAGAFLWEGIAVLMLVAFCVGVVLSGSRSWVSLAVAVAAIGVELWLMKIWLSRETPRG
jgi:hypothetical protein